MEDLTLFTNWIFNSFKSIFDWVSTLPSVLQACFWAPFAMLLVYIFLKFLGKSKGGP